VHVPAEVVRRAALLSLRRLGNVATARWPSFTRLFLRDERAGWSIDDDLRALAWIASELDIPLGRPWPVSSARRQCVFYGSHFAFFDTPPIDRGHRVGMTYFHGLPETGTAEFDRAFAALRNRHHELSRVQVSHRAMERVVLSSGIDPAKVHLIPIGINPVRFRAQTPELRQSARRALGLPDAAFVVGSFQKDGVGWRDGIEPKLIKGPDVLVEAVVELHRQVPELHVLLSGPARGYVRQRLSEAGVPFVHRLLSRPDEIGSLYQALDAYAVPARDEGGPKGVLESMASGIPLVSTRVGQAVDLIEDGRNGWLVDVGDSQAMAERLARVATAHAETRALVAAGLTTAANHTYRAQIPLWRAFFDGFVERQ
jgi:glycosyltransferase involved in cell wall biosynthesis